MLPILYLLHPYLLSALVRASFWDATFIIIVDVIGSNLQFSLQRTTISQQNPDNNYVSLRVSKHSHNVSEW